MVTKNIWLDGIMGVVVGDALGNPVQFMSRDEILNRPEGTVTGMESGGAYDTPIGTWTDDSSMTIATMASIMNKGKIDPEDIMDQFIEWDVNGKYTPFGRAFDQGNTCSSAIYNYYYSRDYKNCGMNGVRSNGNGSLMRIMPACLYYYLKQTQEGFSDEEVIEGIHIISGLTHNHLRSKMCCGFYYFCVRSILDGISKDMHLPLNDLLQDGIDAAVDYYKKDIVNLAEMAHLSRLRDLTAFKDVSEAEINSSGYVIDTIEAVIWCLINTDSFKDCLLKAVNLGEDTDTVGAIAGGLAGLYYGYSAIPEEWLAVIQRREWIEHLCISMEIST